MCQGFVVRVAGGLGLLLGVLHAASAQVAPPDPKQLQEVQRFEDALSVPGVLEDHPDLFYRQLAVDAYHHGDMGRALKMFLRAASYADKPSQAALASMYRDGVGVAVDRPRGYVWIDLAASRGYAEFVGQREYYWAQLSEAERAQAQRVGEEILAKYDDKVALQRLGAALERARMNVTGSHVGAIGNLKIKRPGINHAYDTSGEFVMSGNDLYRDSVWKVDQYTQMKDLEWKVRVESNPSVRVGDLQTVGLPAPASSSAPAPQK
jgi:hypothetical protein